MKQFLLGLTVIILLLAAGGLFLGDKDLFLLKNGIRISVAVAALIWMPLFLFYAYDRRQRKKEKEEEV